jgi:gluconokinase
VIVILMGVSGVGKTTIGTALAASLGWQFVDADDYHPAANVAKMAAGIALQDEDRWPWLDALNAKLREAEARGASVVVACSALKARYRARLTGGLSRYRVVYLHGAFDLIEARMQGRHHRYMPASLLASQFAALEPPQDAIEVDVALDVPAAVAQIAAHLEPSRA